MYFPNISMKLPDVLPISVTQASDHQNDGPTINVSYTGSPHPDEPKAILGKFLADLRRTTLSFT